MSINNIGIFNKMVSMLEVRHSFSRLNKQNLLNCTNNAIASYRPPQIASFGIANIVENLLDIA